MRLGRGKKRARVSECRCSSTRPCRCCSSSAPCLVLAPGDQGPQQSAVPGAGDELECSNKPGKLQKPRNPQNPMGYRSPSTKPLPGSAAELRTVPNRLRKDSIFVDTFFGCSDRRDSKC